MWRETLTLDQALGVLNEMVALDPEATTALCENRVPCNAALADHESIQVSAPSRDSKEYAVGLLGVLNGLFGSDDTGWGQSAGNFELVCGKCKALAPPDTPYEPGAPCPSCGGTYKGVVTQFHRLDPSKFK